MKVKGKIIKLFITLICAIFALSFCFFSVNAEENKEEIVVGVPVDRCPIFYIDSSTNNITGIGVELLKLAAENAGYNLKFTIIKEPTIKEALDNDEYDIIMPFGSAIKSSKGKTSIVTENLFVTPFTFVVVNNLKTNRFGEIHVGMLSSQAGVADTVKELYPGIDISLYPTMEDSIKAVRKGEVDALLHNSYIWSYVLQKPSYSDLRVLSNTMFTMNFKVGTVTSEKGEKIIARLNQGIEQISDTQVQAIVLDYTTRKLYQYDFSDYIYKYGLYVALVALLFLSLIVIALMKNKSMRLAHEKKLQMLVDHDSLTGVLSLEGFKKKAVEMLKMNSDTPYLLIYTNIKNFKFINDNFGKAVGDDLLCFLAGSLNSLATEYEVIARINADRFVILYKNRGGNKMLDDYDRAFSPVKNYLINRGKNETVLLCYGIYVLSQIDYQKINIDRLIDYAHLAEKKVYNTQNEGYAFYNQEQWEKGKRTAEVLNLIPIAIKNGDIHVWYQPQFDYRTGQIIGAEALVRWKRDDTIVAPDYFIPILEETGMIFDLDSYVWEKACQDLQNWVKLGYPDCVVSVNVSRCDINESIDISQIFADLIKKYNLSPKQLRIEITESAYVENPKNQIEVTKKLRNLGFSVEMDDFGSGYSSLNMLKDVTVDRIKLDLYFLTKSEDLKKSHIIVSSMIKMFNTLDVNIIAEGVETKEQADFLLKEGCSAMQGYYFYKPMIKEDFEKLFLDIQKNNKNPKL